MVMMYGVNKPIYIAFADLEKAFDHVNWEKLFNILKDIHIGIKDRQIFQNVYVSEKVVLIKK